MFQIYITSVMIAVTINHKIKRIGDDSILFISTIIIIIIASTIKTAVIMCDKKARLACFFVSSSVKKYTISGNKNGAKNKLKYDKDDNSLLAAISFSPFLSLIPIIPIVSFY